MEFDYNAALEEFIEEGYPKCQQDIDAVKGFVAFLIETKLAAAFAVDGYIDESDDAVVPESVIEVLEEFTDFVTLMGG